jgi:hypothetical protein
MAEITNVVRDLETKKPGRFGKNGAFAQAVSSFRGRPEEGADGTGHSTVFSILRLRGDRWWGLCFVGFFLVVGRGWVLILGSGVLEGKCRMEYGDAGSGYASPPFVVGLC